MGKPRAGGSHPLESDSMLARLSSYSRHDPWNDSGVYRCVLHRGRVLRSAFARDPNDSQAASAQSRAGARPRAANLDLPFPRENPCNQSRPVSDAAHSGTYAENAA